MKAVRLFTITLAASALGCVSDRPTPTGIAANLVKQTGLLQCSSLPATSVKQTIGPAGGMMQIGPHVLVVPPGALAAPVTIATKTAGGTGNAVELKPAGLIFLTPAYLTLSYANCVSITVSKEVAYTTDLLAIIAILPSSDNPIAQVVIGQISHFSNYAIAW